MSVLSVFELCVVRMSGDSCVCVGLGLCVVVDVVFVVGVFVSMMCVFVLLKLNELMLIVSGVLFVLSCM